jgi:hypothetical protein
VRAVGKQFLLQLAEQRVQLGPRRRQRLGEQLLEGARLDLGEEGPVGDFLQVVGEQIDDTMPRAAELVVVQGRLLLDGAGWGLRLI